MDAVYWLDALPEEDTKVFAENFRVAPGGPACNAAITHALLGGRTTLISALGRGIWADAVRARLHALGIRIIDLAEGTNYETPLTTVLIGKVQATRTIVNPPAAEVEIPEVREWQSAWGAMPGIVLSDGFHLRETLPLLRRLKEAGVHICLDGGSWKSRTDELPPLLSAAICSERFAPPSADRSPDATLRWFAERDVPYAAVTRAAESILGSDGGRRFEIEIDRIEAIDTLGAGDVLHGAFCFYFGRGDGFESALRKASEIATRSCAGMGIENWAKGTA